jgi:anti-sigma factor RsiW
MHPSDGTLRRSLDEPVALDPRTRRHLATCPRCSQRLAAIETNAAGAFAVFAAPYPSIDLDAARARLAQTEAATPAKPGAPRSSLHTLPRPRSARVSRVVAGIAVASLASVLLVVSGGAQDFLSLFQPKQFAAVPVTSADIRSLAGLASYGYISGGSTPLSIEPEPDAAAAARAGGLAPLTVRDLPAGTTAAASYAVVSGTVVSFTFDAVLARAAASRAGGQLPAMPQGLDGSTLTVAIAPAVVISYGLDLATLYQGGALPAGGTDVIVVASRTPTVSSTGVTAQQLESYLLSLPGVPAGVAAEIRAIGDPAQTVPVPIPVSLASASMVNVNGARGLLIGDSTQLGSVVLWQHNGVVYAVAGTLSSDQVLGIARSLR